MISIELHNYINEHKQYNQKLRIKKSKLFCEEITKSRE